MALADFKNEINVKEGFSLLRKTTPFIILNLIVYGIFAGATLIYFLIMGGLCYFMHPIAGLIFLLGIGLYGMVAYYVREYILYLIKAAHIAVITELIKNGKVPGDKTQVEFGKKIVKDRIKNVSILFAIDQMVKAILKALNRTVVTIADWIPLPGLDKFAQAVMAVINLSVTYVDEAILSYSLSKGEANPWASAKDGIILYAQSYKAILKNALVVGIIGFISFFAIWIVLMIPGLVITLIFPALKTMIGIAMIVIAYLIKLALYNPLALCTMILTYHRTIEGQVPNPEWEKRLDGISSKFRDLKQKAADWVKGGSHSASAGSAA